MDFGKTGCFDAWVLAYKIIDACRWLIRGFQVDGEHLAFRAIKEIGAGGTFLSSPHTLKNYKEKLWMPKLFTRLDFAASSRFDKKNIGQRAHDKVEKILKEHHPIEMDRDL
jgi:trimethylamine--corrinoid protein Co-methyltransferase